MTRVLWRNSLGEPVDLDNIDKEYALNILTMVLVRRGKQAAWLGSTWAETDEALRTDELVQKLRETVLNGREPDLDDRRRAAVYNRKNAEEGLPFRAPVK